MSRPQPWAPAAPPRFRSDGGSALVTSLLLVTVLMAGLAGYLGLSRTALKLAQRTFFANDAANLADAGLEEALYSFNLMGTGTAPGTAWTGWTFSGADAARTLTPFNRDQNAVGLVKIYVHGYDGSVAAPYVIAQATIAPFDGTPPVVKIAQVALQHKGGLALVALAGLTLNNTTFVDSFNSNPSNSPTGPWAAYSNGIAHANATVAVLSGSVDIASGSIDGNLFLGPGVDAPPADKVTGTITSNFAYTYNLPGYPTPASVSQSYDLGASLPAMLPRSGDLPASDGRYYYFCKNTTIGSVAIADGTRVTIVGTNTGMTSGLTVGYLGACSIYLDKAITLATNRAVNSDNWAGALQIYTTTTTACIFSNNSKMNASLYAPYAAVTITGSGGAGLLAGSMVAKTITASRKMSFHCDESLGPGGSGGAAWALTSWFERQSATDRAAVAPLTNNFLR